MMGQQRRGFRSNAEAPFFCVQEKRPLMAHRSRLGGIMIDCQTDDLTEAVAFWSAVLGQQGRIAEQGKYAVFEDRPGRIGIEIQSVTHAPRVHLDFETDDPDAESARLIGLGATEVARIKDWIVMQAPTGHRFCLVPPERPGFAEDATTFD